MANYYLGLTYYLQRDYNNARGAFENALFKLKDYGVAAKDDKQPDAGKFTEVDSNFVLARYLLARCYQRLGEEELATANFARVVQVRPDLAALADPARNAAANVLVVVDLGDGPRKATDEGGYVTGFVPPPAAAGPIPLPVVTVDGQWLGGNGANSPLVDLLALAQDTRWQTIDTIRTVKSALGTGLIAGGALTAAASGRNRNVGYAGLGLVAAGLLLKATSQADLRVWDTLPRATFAVAMTVPPGKHNLAVSFPAVGGRPGGVARRRRANHGRGDVLLPHAPRQRLATAVAAADADRLARGDHAAGGRAAAAEPAGVTASATVTPNAASSQSTSGGRGSCFCCRSLIVSFV